MRFAPAAHLCKIVSKASATFLTLCMLFSTHALAQVVSYEASDYPETQGWSRSTYCTPERFLDAGWFIQDVGPSECSPPPEGDKDTYARTIASFDGAPDFYVEWRIRVDGQSSEFPWGAPFIISAWNLGGLAYWFATANDTIQFIRDDFAVILYVKVAADTPHTYRLEIFGDDLYVIYIDGIAVHQDVPGGPFPSFYPSITWRARSAYLHSIVYLDYLRYGAIPQTPGDFDSDGTTGPIDFYYFEECLSDTQAGSWPGCAWADMDSDGDTDCADWQAFLAAWNDASEPPALPQCNCPTDLSRDGLTDATDLAQLLGAWGADPNAPADFTGDDVVDAADLALLLGSWGPCP